MRVKSAVVAGLCLLTFLSVGVLGHSMHTRELGIADIPPCGIQCMFLTLPSSGCSLDDTDCLCTSQDFARSNAACLLANCTMADILGAAKAQASICNFSDDSQKAQVLWYTSIVYSIAFILVTLRIIGKLLSQRLSIDDWIVVTALLLTAVPCGCVLHMGRIGFGEHLWNLQDGRLLEILRLFYVSWSTYTAVLCLIKISLVMFFLEIFQFSLFRVCAYTVLVYIIINSSIIFFMTVFVCTPVDAFWNQDKEGKCLDFNQLALANSISSIIQDFILLLLPLPFISKLQIQLYRKIAVGFMFAVGSFGCIATLIRLKSVRAFKVSADPTWDYVTVTIWTELELAAAMACVSLPSIRLLFVRILPNRLKRFFTQITNSSQSRSNPTPNPDAQQRRWKKPSTWMSVSLMPGENFDKSSKSFGSDAWTGRSALRNSSQRLESPQRNFNGSEIEMIRYPIDGETEHDEIEMSTLTELKKGALRENCQSCGSQADYTTALPSMGQIGCLPERTYSNTVFTKH